MICLSQDRLLKLSLQQGELTSSQAAIPWQPTCPDQGIITPRSGSREGCSSDHQEDGRKALQEVANASEQPHEVQMQKQQMSQKLNAAVPNLPDSEEEQNLSNPDANKQAEPSESSELLKEDPQCGKEPCIASIEPEPREQLGMHTSPSAATVSEMKPPSHEGRAFSEQQKKDASLSSSSLHQDTVGHVGKPSAEPNTMQGTSQLAVDPDSPMGDGVGQADMTAELPSAAATPPQPSLSMAAQKDGQASVMDVLMDAQKLATTPADESRVGVPLQ